MQPPNLPRDPREPILLDFVSAGPVRPKWATVIGVLCIIFGTLEALGVLYTPIQIASNRMNQRMLANPQFWAAATGNAPTTQVGNAPGQTYADEEEGDSDANADDMASDAEERTPKNPRVTGGDNSGNSDEADEGDSTDAPHADRSTAGDTGSQADDESDVDAEEDAQAPSSTRYPGTRNVPNMRVARRPAPLPPAFAQLVKDMMTTPPWFETFAIVNAFHSAASAILLLGGGIQLLRQRPIARKLILAYCWVAFAGMAVFVSLAASYPSLLTASGAVCTLSCGIPLPVVLMVYMYLDAQRTWFRELESRRFI